MTETLERVPAHWKVVFVIVALCYAQPLLRGSAAHEHVREKLACRKCDTIVQAPAPSHPIARGRAADAFQAKKSRLRRRPQLLADILFGKYRAHLPLNRQSDIYANEGVEIDVSTMADWVVATAATLMPVRDAPSKPTFMPLNASMWTTPRFPCWPKADLITGRLWT